MRGRRESERRWVEIDRGERYTNERRERKRGKGTDR